MSRGYGSGSFASEVLWPLAIPLLLVKWTLWPIWGPVKIVLDRLPDARRCPLGPGMSVEPSVTVR